MKLTIIILISIIFFGCSQEKLKDKIVDNKKTIDTLVEAELCVDTFSFKEIDYQQEFNESILSSDDWLVGLFIIGNRATLSENKISSINIKNSCLGDLFHINSNGLIEKSEGIYQFYAEYIYSKDGRLLVWKLMDRSNEFPNFAHYYKYNKDGKLNFEIRSEFNEIGQQKLDTIKLNGVNCREIIPTLTILDSISGKRNSKGLIIEQKKTDIHFPCDVNLMGENIFRYNYSAKNLIESAEVIDSSGKCILIFKYEYTYE